MRYIREMKDIEKVQYQYWKISTSQPYFSVGMKKIGVTNKNIDFWSALFISKNIEMYIIREYYNDNYYWKLTEAKSDSWINYADSANYMGKVEVTDDDVELYKNTEKYNL